MANHNQQEAGIVKAQKRERQRNRKQRWGSGNRSDTVGKIFAPFRIWDIIKQFRPDKMEILNVIKILNAMG